MIPRFRTFRKSHEFSFRAECCPCCGGLISLSPLGEGSEPTRGSLGELFVPHEPHAPYRCGNFRAEDASRHTVNWRTHSNGGTE